MSKLVASGFVAGLLCFVTDGAAETRKISWTLYNVAIEQGELLTLPSGNKVRFGVEAHGSDVDDAGVVRSMWCTQQDHLTATDEPIGGAGYCAIYEDNGDVLWVSFSYKGGQPNNTWNVIGGTGQYEGATGSGKTTFVSARGDGSAGTWKSEGSLTTK